MIEVRITVFQRHEGQFCDIRDRGKTLRLYTYDLNDFKNNLN